MKNKPETNGDASEKRLPKAPTHHIADMRRLNQDTLKVVELLNSDIQPEGINHYEMLRRHVREDERLKEAYRGVVNPSKIINDAARVFAMQATADAETAGGKTLDDVLKETSPQKVYETIIKDVLPALITNHVQDYMSSERSRPL